MGITTMKNIVMLSKRSNDLTKWLTELIDPILRNCVKNYDLE